MHSVLKESLRAFNRMCQIAMQSRRTYRLLCALFLRQAFDLLTHDLERAVNRMEAVADGKIPTSTLRTVRSAFRRADAMICYEESSGVEGRPPSVELMSKRESIPVEKETFNRMYRSLCLMGVHSSYLGLVIDRSTYHRFVRDALLCLCPHPGQKEECPECLHRIISQQRALVVDCLALKEEVPASVISSLCGWNDGTIQRLALAAYERHDTSGLLDTERLYVLADALEETHSSESCVWMSQHLRQGLHWRGCWVVQQLLGFAIPVWPFETYTESGSSM